MTRSRRRPATSRAYRAGFACLVGRPNAGKSTLTNALVGQKVAITSSKPQTTRHTIRGIAMSPGAQLVLVDTPGLHKPRTLLGQRLNDLVRETLLEVDVIGFCLPADQRPGPGDTLHRARALRAAAGQAEAGRGHRDEERPGRPEAAGRAPHRHRPARGVGRDHPVLGDPGRPGRGGARRAVQPPAGVAAALPLDGVLTDEPEAVMIAELVREAALEGVRDELPHPRPSSSRRWCRADRPADRPLLDVRVNVYVERSSQKAIVIGRGGLRLREVGTTARRQIEALSGSRCTSTCTSRSRRTGSATRKQLRQRLPQAVSRESSPRRRTRCR